MKSHIHDLIIIGGGPGGYTAALYAARAGLDVLLLEKLSAGGQMALSQKIDNYPGFEEGIDGFDLGEKMRIQAEAFGAKTEYAQVQAVDLSPEVKHIHTGSGTYRSKTVVIATGANPKQLGLPAEQALVGRGVAYCAACDGMAYRGKTVAVIGGGNSAVAEALLLSRLAKKVYLIHRRDTLRATKVYHRQLENAENIELVWNSQPIELLYDDRLTGVRLQNTVSGEQSQILCDGIFISIGRAPATQLLNDQLALDENGYILADESTQTSIPGVYAVGDVRTKQLRQIVTAVADGAIAAHQAEEYLISVT